MTHQIPTPYPLTGIVLAGGKSSRFQEHGHPWQDKALFKIAPNTSLLAHAIRTLAPFCEEIIIVVNTQERKTSYRAHLEELKLLKSISLSFIIDDQQLLCSGPIRAFLSTFPRVKTPFALVMPVDMPMLSPPLLQTFIKTGMNCSLLYPFWLSTGKIEPLTFIFRVETLLPYMQFLRYFETSRADDLIRLAPSVSFLPIKREKEALAKAMFQSINERSDLALLKSSLKMADKSFSIFAPEDLLTFQNKIDPSLFTKFLTYLQNHHSIQPNSQEGSLVLQLAHSLQREMMLFHAGSLLQLTLSSFSQRALIPPSLQPFYNTCFKAFYSEAQLWEQRKIIFVAYHALLDALKYLPAEKLTKEQLDKKIISYRKNMALNEKNHRKRTFSTLFESQVPKGFLQKVEKVIHKAEAQFNAEAPPFESNFLWDHSLRVSKIAFKIAVAEGVEPLIPVIAALFHDAGKFVLGQYHKDDLPEEEHSANIAKAILSGAGFSSEQVAEVMAAIEALYAEKMSCNHYCQIVHDADRLEKLGFLGVANFFTKMTLRGVNLTQSLLKYLSRELTYALAAPETMLTKTGKKLATQLGKKTRDFFIELLNELIEWDMGKFIIREVLPPKGNFPVVLVFPQTCRKCVEGRYTVDLSTESGIKCEKLVVNYHCTHCADSFTIQFCLPLIDSN